MITATLKRAVEMFANNTVRTTEPWFTTPLVYEWVDRAPESQPKCQPTEEGRMLAWHQIPKSTG